MPKAYLLEEDRQAAKIERIILGYMKSNRIRQKDLAEAWQCTQAGVSYKIMHGNITVLDLWKAQKLLHIETSDLFQMIGE